jgi:hypothetical protein
MLQLIQSLSIKHMKPEQHSIVIFAKMVSFRITNFLSDPAILLDDRGILIVGMGLLAQVWVPDELSVIKCCCRDRPRQSSILIRQEECI